MVNQNPIQTQRPGWSWPRFPWQRNDSHRFRQAPSSPDSQYGFPANIARLDDANMLQSYALINNSNHFGLWGPPPPYSDPNSPIRHTRYQFNQCHQLADPLNSVIESMQTTAQPAVANLDCSMTCRFVLYVQILNARLLRRLTSRFTYGSLDLIDKH